VQLLTVSRQLRISLYVTLLQSLSEQSSLSDVYAVIDKTKKKNSAGAIVDQKISTRPKRIHDYEDIDEKLPPVVPPYHGEVKKTAAHHSQSLATTVDSNR